MLKVGQYSTIELPDAQMFSQSMRITKVCKKYVIDFCQIEKQESRIKWQPVHDRLAVWPFEHIHLRKKDLHIGSSSNGCDLRERAVNKAQA